MLAPVLATSPLIDFFISYTAVDEKWAEIISWWLEEAGFSVLFQKWDFRAGNNFVNMMQRGLRAKHMIAVLSPAYLESKFCMQEWHAAGSDDPLGLGRRIIPVRVKKCAPDGLLKPVVYLDLVGIIEEKSPDMEDIARKKMLDGLVDRGKPLVKPNFPEPDSRLTRTTGDKSDA